MKEFIIRVAHSPVGHFKYSIRATDFANNFDNIFIDFDEDIFKLKTAISLLRIFNGEIHKTENGYVVILPLKFVTDIETVME